MQETPTKMGRGVSPSLFLLCYHLVYLCLHSDRIELPFQTVQIHTYPYKKAFVLPMPGSLKRGV